MYVTMPTAARWSDWIDAENYLARTVHEQEPERRDTGLLDAAGVKLWRVEEKRPIGFVRYQ